MATERILVIIDTVTGGAIRGMNQTGAAATGMGTNAGAGQRALSAMGLQGTQTGWLLRAGVVGGAVVAGAAVAKFALDGQQQFVSLASETRNLQRVMGGTAE